MPKPDLDSAYSLTSTAEAKRFYADWAEDYDTAFIEAHDFVLPARVAEAFAAAGGGGPVLDFGTGTGAMGVELARRGIGPVDGVDLSPEMLAVAQRKKVYRDLIAGNILDGLVLPAPGYRGIVSSGTFTQGHVGPEALDALLRLAAPGAQFALSINARHFESHGFAAKFDALEPVIDGLQLPRVSFYGPNATGAHKDDTGLVALFRKR